MPSRALAEQVTISERTFTIAQPLTAPRTAAPDTADDAAWAINLFAAAVVLTGYTCLDAWLVHPVGPRLALLAAAVTVIAERVADPRTALGCAALAFVLGNGFLQHHTGELGWSTTVDYPYLLVLLGGVALGVSVGQARLAWRRRHRWDPLRTLVDDAARSAGGGPVTPAPRGDEHVLRSRQEPTVTTRDDLSV